MSNKVKTYRNQFLNTILPTCTYNVKPDPNSVLRVCVLNTELSEKVVLLLRRSLFI